VRLYRTFRCGDDWISGYWETSTTSTTPVTDNLWLYSHVTYLGSSTIPTFEWRLRSSDPAKRAYITYMKLTFIKGKIVEE